MPLAVQYTLEHNAPDFISPRQAPPLPPPPSLFMRMRGAAATAGMMFVGLVLPDIDLAIPFLPHRSGLTHSLLPGLVLMGYLPRRLVAGLWLGQTVAMVADLFPQKWTGFATIHLPFMGSLGAVMSPLWLLANSLAALMLARGMLGLESRETGAPDVAVLTLAVADAWLIEHDIFPLMAFIGLWVVSRRLGRLFLPERGA